MIAQSLYVHCLFMSVTILLVKVYFQDYNKIAGREMYFVLTIVLRHFYEAPLPKSKLYRSGVAEGSNNM